MHSKIQRFALKLLQWSGRAQIIVRKIIWISSKGHAAENAFLLPVKTDIVLELHTKAGHWFGGLIAALGLI